MCLIYCNQGLAGTIHGAVLATWTHGSVPDESRGVGGRWATRYSGEDGAFQGASGPSTDIRFLGYCEDDRVQSDDTWMNL